MERMLVRATGIISQLKHLRDPKPWGEYEPLRGRVGALRTKMIEIMDKKGAPTDDEYSVALFSPEGKWTASLNGSPDRRWVDVDPRKSISIGFWASFRRNEEPYLVFPAKGKLPQGTFSTPKELESLLDRTEVVLQESIPRAANQYSSLYNTPTPL